MNREIKFKYYYKINTRNGLEINPIIHTIEYLERNNLTAKDDIIIAKCQYTGLKDKNGKEIYEGDIIEYTQHYFNLSTTDIKTKTVQFDFDKWNVYATNAGESNIKVVGNIHEKAETDAS